MEHLVAQDQPLPGMADPDPAARFLVQHMLAVAGDRPGLHVFVTHESLVTAAAARLLGEPLGKDDWPWYLEGGFFRRQGAHVVTACRDRCNEEEAEVRRTRDGVCGHRSMPGAVSSAMPPCQALRRPTG